MAPFFIDDGTHPAQTVLFWLEKRFIELASCGKSKRIMSSIVMSRRTRGADKRLSVQGRRSEQGVGFNRTLFNKGPKQMASKGSSGLVPLDALSLLKLKVTRWLESQTLSSGRQAEFATPASSPTIDDEEEPPTLYVSLQKSIAFYPGNPGLDIEKPTSTFNMSGTWNIYGIIVQRIAVRTSDQRQGIGSSFIQFLQSEAVRLRFPFVMVEAVSTSKMRNCLIRKCRDFAIRFYDPSAFIWYNPNEQTPTTLPFASVAPLVPIASDAVVVHSSSSSSSSSSFSSSSSSSSLSSSASGSTSSS